MIKRPWPLVLLAVFHFFAPVVNIGLNALYSGIDVGTHFAHALSWPYLAANWPIIVLPLLCGYAIYACKRWSFYTYIALLGILFFLNYQGYLSKSDTMGIFPVVMVYAVNILVVAYFLVPAVRNIYFNPRLRWWEQNPRYRSNIACTYGTSATDQNGHVGNFSLGGMFIRSETYPEDYETIQIAFDFEGTQHALKGRVILHHHQEKIGFGVEFDHTPDTFSKTKKICHSLDKQGHKIERDPESKNNTLGQWLKTFFTTGKGLFPKT